MKKSQAGFSLVEVTLAIGVVAFAFIGVFGLIPTGLNTFHQAIDASVGSQIAQRVINDVQQTDFTALVSGTSFGGGAFIYQWPVSGSSGTTTKLRYFDGQGEEVFSVSQAIYQVQTWITPATSVPSGASCSSLATVTIQVATNPGNRTPAIDPTTQLWTNGILPVSTYSCFVAQNINQ